MCYIIYNVKLKGRRRLLRSRIKKEEEEEEKRTVVSCQYHLLICFTLKTQ